MAMLHDPRTQSPDECRRLNSGFWKRDYDMCTQTETWTCDKRKLNDKVAEAMLDHEFRRSFNMAGPSLLDKMFGEGTAEAFSHKTSNDRVMMRFNPFNDRQMLGMDLARKDSMALTTFANMNTGTTTTTAATVSNNTNEFFTVAGSSQMFIRDEVRAAGEKAVKAFGSKPSRKLIKNIPFKVEYGGSLLASLQREFDHWAGDQMKLVNSYG